MKVFLVCLLLSLVTIESHSAILEIYRRGACANGRTWSTTVYIDGASGRPLGASGIDCSGNTWSTQYSISNTPPAGGSAFSIETLTPSTLTLFSSLSVSYQIIDLQTGLNVGSLHGPSVAEQSFQINISSLPTGVYGIVGYDSSNGTLGFLQFSN